MTQTTVRGARRPPRAMHGETRPHVGAGLLAALASITVNALLLQVAHPLGVKTGGSALQRLLVAFLHPLIAHSNLAHEWGVTGLPAPGPLPFALAFHYATGVAMAALYVLALEPRLPGSPAVKGLLFSLLPWLVNGLVVLPLLGQGALGLSALPLAGVAYFFMANVVFGVLLGVFYARFRDRRQVAWGA